MLAKSNLIPKTHIHSQRSSTDTPNLQLLNLNSSSNIFICASNISPQASLQVLQNCSPNHNWDHHMHQPPMQHNRGQFTKNKFCYSQSASNKHHLIKHRVNHVSYMIYAYLASLIMQCGTIENTLLVMPRRYMSPLCSHQGILVRHQSGPPVLQRDSLNI